MSRLCVSGVTAGTASPRVTGDLECGLVEVGQTCYGKVARRIRRNPHEYAPRVAYDEALAERIRALTAGEAGIAEKQMFGGLAFLVNGNMAVAASGQGGILLRVDPAESAALVAGSAAQVAVMRGREMPGWLRVGADELVDESALAEWVGRGIALARSLPAKR